MRLGNPFGCITGGIAEAFYRDVPDGIRAKVRGLLAPDLLRITEAFCRKYIQGSQTLKDRDRS